MAQVRIEEIVDHLSSEMRKPLEETLREVVPNVQVDPYELVRTFRRAVRYKCNDWE